MDNKHSQHVLLYKYMPEPIPQKNNDGVVIRTMKGDLEKISSMPPVPLEKLPAPPLSKIPAKEPTLEAPKPVLPAPPVIQPPTVKPPVLVAEPKAIPPAPLKEIPEIPKEIPKIIPPKIIPPKEIPEIPTKLLQKAAPAWVKLGLIGFGLIILVFLGIYGYWKLFVKTQPAMPPTTPVVVPTLPAAPIATTTLPIKFFNKLPHKAVTIDLSAKTSVALLKALKAEMVISETLASIKQIKITYQGKPITTEEFFNLMLIFSPKDFLTNYESEFALAFFTQKEGARPALILKIKNRELTQTQMTEWEKKTLPSDIFPLFLTDFKLPKTLPTFKSYLFVNQLVHYLNVSVPFASLNYTIYNNYLIFTTSSAGMFVILQDLTGQNISLEYFKNLEAAMGK